VRSDRVGISPRRDARLGRAVLWFWLLALVIVLRPDSGPRRVRGERPRSQPQPRARAADGKKTPNLLLLVADDHRGGTLGVDGDPRRATPRLDALARQGVRFDRAYCNAPVCTPSRQSFITGRLPHAVGVTRLASALPESAVTLGDWLSRLGYDTAAFGKMHFNGPSRHGFRERIDLEEWRSWLAANPPAGGDHRRPWQPLREPAASWLNAACRPAGLPAASMDSTFFADQAIDFLREHRDSPFALVVSFYDPHSPFRFPDGWASRYAPEAFPVPHVSEADLRQIPLVFRGLNGRDAQGIQAAYYSSLSWADHQVGRVLDDLDGLGLGGDTVVVYLGDNGYLLGEHGRFEKHCFYEPAVRVPLLVRWRGHLPEDRRVAALVELVDVLPTVLELLGVTVPPGVHGRSLVPLLRGEPGATGREVVFSEYLENEEAMVRSSRFKLIVGNGRRKRTDGYDTGLPPSGPYQRLFDLQADPDETTDLADRPELSAVKADLMRELHLRLTSTRDRAAPPLPPGLSPDEAIRLCLIPHDPVLVKQPKGVGAR
jgi:choline-sulfatase